MNSFFFVYDIKLNLLLIRDITIDKDGNILEYEDKKYDYIICRKSDVFIEEKDEMPINEYDYIRFKFNGQEMVEGYIYFRKGSFWVKNLNTPTLDKNILLSDILEQNIIDDKNYVEVLFSILETKEHHDKLRHTFKFKIVNDFHGSKYIDINGNIYSDNSKILSASYSYFELSTGVYDDNGKDIYNGDYVRFRLKTKPNELLGKITLINGNYCVVTEDKTLTIPLYELYSKEKRISDIYI